MMKAISLTQGKVMTVDDIDFYWLKSTFKKFQFVRVRNKYGYANTTKKVGGSVKRFSVHRLIVERMYGEIPAGKEVDHIDRNPLNNTRSNLRIVTHSENCYNRSNSGKRTIICSKCKTNIRYKSLPYCKECWSKYQKQYRNNDERRKKEREYKRIYRNKLKKAA